MATKNIELPEIGEGVNEGELVSWLVQPGDTVEVDQAIAELMTDKATVEVPSPIAGTVKDLKFSEGDTIEVGATMITVEEGAGAATKTAPAKTETKTTTTTTTASAPAPAVASAGGMSTITPPPADVSVLATPSTRRLAREMSVDINQVSGTGLAGRVTRDDVMKYTGGAGATAAGPAMPVSQPYMPPQNFTTGGEERVPLKGIRKKIAENMQMAKRIVPHFTLMDEANVTKLIELRNDLKPAAEKMGVKVTYLPFVMKALIATVREFPKFNGMIDDAAQEIVFKKYFNIGFAADTPNGLLVPVLKNADQKTIYQLSAEIVDLATRARDGKLSLDEMKGACFTITNIGSVGGTYATPIINHPEVAIFGMYKIQERPVIVNGELDVASFMNFTVTCDHRLIDGAEAARFLSAFIERIEHPGRLMMDMI
ncbi:MAG: 2-oxo acid dehydrogenase subunit E2 [Bdellovibrionales bacterium]|nr:2-oxo acid dehydrogenase subunit E2 [Bdellovibrionales bacterium]